MNVHMFLGALKRRVRWLAGLLLVFLILAGVIYARSADKYVTIAVTTAKSNEERSFDAGSLSGLAALAGGSSQRPAFEQLSYLVQSSPVIRKAIPTLARDNPQMVKDLSSYSPIARLMLNMEQAARKLFGKPPVAEEPTERVIKAIRASLKIDKTPEGYIRLTFSNGLPAGQVNLVRNILKEADAIIRTRERSDYQARINIYRSLLDRQDQAAERSILVSLITREFSSYVTAQSGELFSFKYVEPAIVPTVARTYSFFTIVLLAVFAAFSCYILLVLSSVWLRGR